MIKTAYQQTPFTGFRTFVKGTSGSVSFESMPFAPHFSEPAPAQKPNRTMTIGMNEMEISERDPVTNLRTTVLYFTVPEEEFACMVRRVTFTNEGTESMELEVIDGLAKLEPYGIPNGNLDMMGRTMEVGGSSVMCCGVMWWERKKNGVMWCGGVCGGSEVMKLRHIFSNPLLSCMCG